MGYYLNVDEKDGEALASNMGMKDLRQWIEGLPAQHYPQLAHLMAQGWSQDIHHLAAEVEAAMKTASPKSADVISTAHNLHELLKGAAGATVVSVTSGI